MDKKDRDLYRKQNPLLCASLLSKITFSWTFATFWKGYKRDLDPSDLFSPLEEHRSSKLAGQIETRWNSECSSAREHNHKPSLLRVLLSTFGFNIFRLGTVLAVMEVVVKVFQPVFLGGLIDFFRQRSDITKTDAYLYALGIVVSSAVNVVVIHPYMMATMHVGMKMRLSCCSLVYRKALRLSKTALGDATVGQAVNLISNDVGRFDSCVLFFPYLLIGPLQAIAVTYFLWRQIGIASIFGVTALLAFIPIQVWLGKKTSCIRLRIATRTDKRVRLMNEIIAGIQVIKMYAWEIPFAKFVNEARRAELKEISKTAYIRGILSSFTIFHIRIAIFVSILAYVFCGNYINATKVFIVTSYFNVLQHTMTVYMPKAITQGAEALISIRRLETFLLSPEANICRKLVPNGHSARKREVEESEADQVPPRPPYAVAIDQGSAKWLPSLVDNTLNNVSLHIRPGQLVAIIGPVGCGKTSLLQAILGELPLQVGELNVSGLTSYASQEPWLFAGSVRQNILFGATYDKNRYRKVVEVCALWQDFKQLFAGDKTIVGERGVSLSGGQKARINLARAIYKQADIYLLDDPLSAVDPRVSNHLFKQCIMACSPWANGLCEELIKQIQGLKRYKHKEYNASKRFLKNKTVILVTHQLQHLDIIPHIVLMQAGSVLAEGTHKELQASGQQFTKLLQSSVIHDRRLSVIPEEVKNSRIRLISQLSVGSSLDGGSSEDISQEDYASGGIRSYVFTEYFSAAGHKCVIILILLMCTITQLLANGGDYWVTYWVNLEEYIYPQSMSFPFNITTSSDVNHTEYHYWFYTPRDICITVFSLLTIATFVFTLLRSYLFFFMCIRASMKLHHQMFHSVTRATMYFFQDTSSGRILNRFAKDIGTVDENLPNCAIECIQRGLTLLGVILVVAAVNTWVLVPTFFIAVLFYYLRKLYLSTSQSVKRLESIARSPVFAHLSATIQGLTTIRAFNAEHMLSKEFDHHQDVHSSAWFIFLSSSRAFGFWLDLVCLLYISSVVFSFLLFDHHVYGAMVGLSITQAMGLTGMLQFGMRQSAELENIMTCVERVLEYSRLESEPSLENSSDHDIPMKWPHEGRIEFRRVSMRYAHFLPKILKDVTFHIIPKEKIGIVGRTGAGKSSLISALFRLYDVEGEILIDDMNTESVGLHALRTNISIIPQEPVLFSGTLRTNLDPFEQYSDEQLWSALEEVELKDAVQDLVGGLQWRMAEGGSNFSVGQRQLVCLARAILRNNHLLILDEATANVDPQTDALIQSTIRRKFANCTVLTIAHRLHTIMDSDKLMVLDAGVLVEFDHPWKLLHNKHSLFYRMVKETGQGTAELLHAVAAQNYQRMKQKQQFDADLNSN